jgi:competence protein ComGC
MKNKAFTLVELLGVIVLIGILSVVIIPKVSDSIQNSKETSYIAQEDMIKKAVNDFLIENTNILETNDTITITLGTLKQGGYLPISIKNPKTRKEFSNESLITITKNGSNYDISLSLIDLQNVTETIDDNSPILVLNGNYIEYVEVNTAYEEKGAYAYSSTGANLNVSTPTIKQNNNVVSQINTGTLGTYNVIYEVTNNGKTTSATRTVIVRDTTAPTIIFPKDTTIHTSEVAGFDPLKGVSATDNYNNNITITANNSSLANLPGNYIITYTATDSSGNTTTERRVINVDGNFANYYVNLEYIQSTGTQYIDTGYVPNSTTKVEMDCDITASAVWLFGSRTTTGSSDSFGVYLNSDTQYWIRIGSSDSTSEYKPNVTSTLGRYTIYASNANFKQDNQSLTSYSANNTTGSNNMYIGTINVAGIPDNRRLTGKIYSVKIWDDNTLVRNMIPAKRNSDNEIGLYDEVNDKFYTNSGTGKFEYRMQNENPYERLYTKLEYLESTGTQYIKTDYHLKGISNVELQFSHSQVESSVFSVFFGARENTQKRGYLFGDASSSNKYFYGFYGDADTTGIYKSINVNPEYGKIYNLSINNGTFRVSDLGEIQFTPINFTLNSSMYIFAFNENESATCKLRGRIYYFKIWENNELVRNFIPAVRNSDNVAGLYDEVNDVFYTNSGTGEFTRGNPIN